MDKVKNLSTKWKFKPLIYIERTILLHFSWDVDMLRCPKKNKPWKTCGRLNIDIQNLRSSHKRCSSKKGVLRNFAKFTGKHLCQSLFLNKDAGLRPAIILKRGFPVNFAKFLKTTFLQNTSGRLLLKFTDLFKIKVTILGMKYLALWEETKQLR